jgi:hypothetical protein
MTDPTAGSTVAFGATQALCRRHGLTAYLELAIRENQALPTVDQELRRAAAAENMPVL